MAITVHPGATTTLKLETREWYIAVQRFMRRSAVSHAGGRAGGVGLLTEHELTRVLQMLDAIQAKIGIENHANSALADLDMGTKPEDVLAEIAQLQQRALRRKKPTP